MQITKRLTALALCAALVLLPARAAEEEEKFPRVNTYPGFVDVKDGDWFVNNVKVCYETGLMLGTGGNAFSPDRTLMVSECAAIAARLHNALHGNKADLSSAPGASWWQASADYLRTVAQAKGDLSAVDILTAPDAPISRMEFFRMLALADDDDLLTPINAITLLPDTDDATVLAFYNAGILAGTDKYGTFAPGRTLTRMECAAMVSRIADASLRVSFLPADYSPYTAAGVQPSDTFFPNITAETFLTEINGLIAHLERLCQDSAMEFNWFNTYGDQTFLDYVKATALTDLGTSASAGTLLYQYFDLQVYYSRLIDARGGQHL